MKETRSGGSAVLTVGELASLGGRARAVALTPERRREIACLAVAARERKREPQGFVRNPALALDRAYRHARYARELAGAFSESTAPARHA